MAQAQQLLKPAAHTLLYRIIGVGTSLLATLVLARWLNAEDYGLFSMGLAWLFILGTLGSFGAETTLVRFVSQYKEGLEAGRIVQIAYWSMLRSLKISVAVTALCCIPLWYWSGEFTRTQLISAILVLLCMPLYAFQLNSGGILRGLRRFRQAAFSDYALRASVFVIALVFCTQLLEPRLVYSNMALIASQLLATLIAFGFLFQSLDSSVVSGTAGDDGQLYSRVAFYIGITNVSVILLANLSVIVVGLVLSPDDAGPFRVATQVAMLLMFPFNALNAVLMPTIASLYRQEDYRRLMTTLRMSTRLTFSVSLVLGMAVVFWSEGILTVFGDRFGAYQNVLCILVVAQLANIACGPVGSVLSMTGHQEQLMRVMLLAVLVNAVLLVVLSLTLGLVGAALSVLLTTVVWNALLLSRTRKLLGIDPSVVDLFKGAAV